VLAAVLETDPAFLAQVAEVARGASPELADGLEAGRVPPAADPVEVAALAYVLRVPGWRDRIAEAASAADAAAAASTEVQQEVTRLREQLEATRAQARAALEAQRAEATRFQSEARSLRTAVADARRAAAAAESARSAAVQAAEEATADAVRKVAAAESEVRRLRGGLAETERALEAARRDARSGRSAEDVRLRLLLDTLVESAHSLRRELALPPVSLGERPGDAVVAGQAATEEAPSPAPRALAPDDPAVLDALLELPQVHLVVDGYNVTKTGYGTLPLQAQRSRLVTGLAALASRTRAEVTCVFDGADLDAPVPGARTRNVRVVFSEAGTTADVVVRRMVRAEPRGRPVVVVSSDREVVEGVRASGAYAVPSSALLQRLERA
jgi:predicted RNA-binding protein with PIN domain